MANQYGINLAQVMGNVEGIKGRRTNNKMNALNLGRMERQEANRPNVEKRQNMLSGLRQEAVGGNIDASKRLLALDPEGAPAFIDAVSKMNDAERVRAKEGIEAVGQLSAYVLQAETPQEQEARYYEVLKGASPEIVQKMPKTYSPEYMKYSLSKAMSMDDLLQAPTVKQVGGDDVVYRNGKEIERKARPQKASANALGGGLKSGDESLMYRQAVELLGGMFRQDPETGEVGIVALDPSIRPKVQAITTEAAKIFKEIGTISRAEAVTRAAAKYGIEVAKQSDQTPKTNDPGGIRDFINSQ